MKLSEIMSAAGLSAYAEVALILFLFAFVLILVTVFAPSRAKWYERARSAVGLGGALLGPAQLPVRRRRHWHVRYR